MSWRGLRDVLKEMVGLALFILVIMALYAGFITLMLEFWDKNFRV